MMTKKKAKIALVGCGIVAKEWHLNVVKLSTVKPSLRGSLSTRPSELGTQSPTLNLKPISETASLRSQ